MIVLIWSTGKPLSSLLLLVVEWSLIFTLVSGISRFNGTSLLSHTAMDIIIFTTTWNTNHNSVFGATWAFYCNLNGNCAYVYVWEFPYVIPIAFKPLPSFRSSNCWYASEIIQTALTELVSTTERGALLAFPFYLSISLSWFVVLLIRY